MQRSLAKSLLAPVARTASASTARPGPSIRTVAFSSFSNGARSYYQQRTTLCSSRAIQRRQSLRTDSVEASLGYRAFSSTSIARYADDTKDKAQPSNMGQESRDDDKHTPPLGETANKSSPRSESATDPVKPPEPSSSSQTTPPPTDTKKSNTATTQSAILERLRSATASLPSFDGLTSSTSLSNHLSTITTSTSNLLTTLRTKLSHLSTQYNTHTGYSAIEELKSRIAQLESSLDAARALASSSKKTYLLAVQDRSASQRETNDLLSRKNAWDERDLSRYTELLRKEHALSRHESDAEKVLERTEADVQACFDELMRAVMVRYHEEQIWSDRMRGMSTYGSLVVAGLNAFLFILAILLVEPYKRKKLAETFESRLVAAEHESRQLILASVDQFQHSLNSVLAASPAAAEPTEIPAPPVLQDEPQDEDVEAALPPVDAPPAIAAEALRKREEERLVFASTLGVVVGAALSLVISACWT
ncbi:related to SHE9-mitochondrial inner membrane protein [Sporisorium reilianum SRZ2]|uniref:Sensitive to high expression protein 9, mitochondrial n=1 Tax=Sporisorium reilianum (strain SRZ2) TaxID=999809 RepID=E6ZNB1_SPORE|nr:related to SHE9-mitochondrial inner membrane protein [Sporisorium reilianum SRZ2]